MTGFRNAPEITEFKRGMRIAWGSSSWDVVYVWPDTGRCGVVDIVGFLTILPEEMGAYDLDLDSIWEGRIYEHVGCGARSTVVEAGPKCVVFRDEGSTSWELRGVFTFKEYYKPMNPEPEPAVKVGDIVQKDIEVKTDETILCIEGPGFSYRVGQLLDVQSPSCTENITNIYATERPGPCGPMTIYRIWVDNRDHILRRAALEINAAAVTTVTFEGETP